MTMRGATEPRIKPNPGEFNNYIDYMVEILQSLAGDYVTTDPKTLYTTIYQMMGLQAWTL
jgi:hypothetical protein